MARSCGALPEAKAHAKAAAKKTLGSLGWPVIFRPTRSNR